MATGRKTGGRQKGTPNKLSHDVRLAILTVAEGLGGAKRMEEWARSDPVNERIFWSQIYIKVLPKEIKAEPELTSDPLDELLRAIQGTSLQPVKDPVCDHEDF